MKKRQKKIKYLNYLYSVYFNVLPFSILKHSNFKLEHFCMFAVFNMNNLKRFLYKKLDYDNPWFNR